MQQPFPVDPRGAAHAARPVTSPLAGGESAVLVVDDDPDLAEELALGLRSPGLAVETVGSAAAARQLLARRPDILVVVTDVRMPGQDGLNFARDLLAETPAECARKLIVMTGHATLEDAVAAVRTGAFDFLRKPFGLDAMAEVVGRALAAARAERSQASDAAEVTQRLAEVEAERSALKVRDPATGLANAQSLAQHLDQLPRGQASVLLLGLEALPRIASVAGSNLAEGLAVQAAERLRAVLGEGVLLARAGPASFAAVLTDATATQQEAVARAMLEALRRPLLAAGDAFAADPRLGLVAGAAAGATPLLVAAHVALDAARQAGRGLVHFVPEMHAAAARRLRIAHDLPQALAAGELRLCYQPIVAVRDRTVLGMEALLRWRHAGLGDISPAEFVPVAEEGPAIHDLWRWVLQEAAGQSAAWRARPGKVPYISVNVSGRQLEAGDLPGTIEAALRRAGLPPEAIVAEITEGVAAGPGAAEPLEQLRRAGVRVALDDFGAAYSSLTALRTLPLDIVKLDRGLLPAGREASGARFFRDLARMLSGLDLWVVAEGVETEAQLALVAEAGCGAVQGYLTGRPAAPGDIMVGQP